MGSKQDLGVAFAKTGRSTLAFKADGVAVRRVDIRERDLAGELGRHRPDFQRHADGKSIRPMGLDLIAAGDALLEHLRIVECVPGLLLGDGQFAATLHFHFESLC